MNAMCDISGAADLLATACDALTQELLPLLPKERRYVGLMIGNALGIASRELQTGAAADAGEAQRCAMLLARSGIPLSPSIEAGPAALAQLRRALCDAIRAGRFDESGAQAALMEHLTRTASDWVSISNPKALNSTGEGE